MASNDVDDNVDLNDFLLCGGDGGLLADLDLVDFPTISPRSVTAVSVSDTVEDSTRRKMEKLQRHYLRFHESCWKFGLPIPSVPSDLQDASRGPYRTSNYWFDDEDWTAVEKDSHIEIFAADSCLPYQVAMVFGQSAGQECTAVLSAIDQYRHFFRKTELLNLQRYLLDGFEVAYKNGNFYCVDDDDDGRMEPINVAYGWICKQYQRLMSVSKYTYIIIISGNITFLPA